NVVMSLLLKQNSTLINVWNTEKKAYWNLYPLASFYLIFDNNRQNEGVVKEVLRIIFDNGWRLRVSDLDIYPFVVFMRLKMDLMSHPELFQFTQEMLTQNISQRI